MKRLIPILAALMLMAMPAHADLLQLLRQAAGSVTNTDSTAVQTTEPSTSSSATSSSSSSFLDGLTSIGTALGIIPERTVTIQYLTGKWEYSSPAVSFKSDNFLQRAGGLAAASQVQSKLEPYYNTLGFNTSTLEVNADSTFTLTVRRIKLSGTISTSTDNKTLTFKFRAFGGRVSAGQMDAYVNAMSGSEMQITFDVTKLVEILKRVASISGNSTINAVTTLLDSYEGITAGMTMRKTS